ncbi:2-hydroxyacid dehydrogenase [Cochlodiniinecator piscidefendens]|uniref:2-hydroxyacid dehydrogenase n=1 Tax=Cochlodiniinecator piscidefendens TaxID=2715756 RepID=UPI00140E94FE|nr:glyoxylate/hydroxypyruvate reductase A [Cochlodiniinecator piscidefendens]
MPINVLFAARDDKWETYQPALNTAFEQAGLSVDLHCNFDHPEDVDYIVYAPNGPVTDFTPYTKTKAILSLWAGVENIVTNKTLTQPLARMVDDGLSEGMVEWVTGHVLRYHLDMDADVCDQSGEWVPHYGPLARERKVAILGMGALGKACALALKALNFDVIGWSRRPKKINNIPCAHGDDGLKSTLQQAEIVVLLLPKTAETENLLNAERISLMHKGAKIINPGRGPLIDDDALLSALNNGQIAHATLDVFRVEPLPKDHAYWAHPNVTVTPHIAADTRPNTACAVIAENIQRGEAGQPFLHLVDRKAGY